MQRWYCVHTRPRAEAQALEHLQRQGFECLLPRIQRLVVRGGRRQVVVEPLFPRYLFLSADADICSLASVRSTRGVLDMVRTAGQPATVPTIFIEQLREDLDVSCVIRLPKRPLHRGDCVTIAEGPLAGFQGLYAQTKGEHRALVLFEILGGTQGITLPTSVLRPTMEDCVA